jgi:putrescine---pyruvate transaminase
VKPAFQRWNPFRIWSTIMNVVPKNINLEEIVKADIAHHFHPFTDHKAFYANGGPRVMTHADGVYIWDGKGNKILDGMAGLGA